MSEVFLKLSADERREALAVAASASGRPAHLLEKDIWVVWALDALFSSPLGEHLVFKGGTSLSKAYGVIRRFSEDVDLTYDIRALAPDLVGETGDALPATRGEERRWTKAVGQRLPQWVEDHVLPTLQARLAVDDAPAQLRLEGEKVFVEYEPLATGSGYVAPAVMLEFGARSTGEPSALHDVVCDAAGLVEGVVFPTARPMVMRAERTFWEKATAIHVFCAQGRLRGDRFARHWHDLARLDDAGFAEAAIADPALAQAVAAHKAMFFVEKDAGKAVIDYQAAVHGALHLAPDGEARAVLGADYEAMVADGLLFDDAEPFDQLMAHCLELEGRINAAMHPAP